MAPLKFEEHIKDKLEQRKLQPSAEAWQKLNNLLDEDASKKNNTVFWWLGIAASLVGVFLVVTFMMNSENESTIIPAVVETENVDPISKDKVVKQTPNDLEKEQDDTNATKDENESSIKSTPKELNTKKPSLLKQKIDTEQNKLVPTTTDAAVAGVKVKQVDERKMEKTSVINTLTDEQLKIEAVVAEMQKLQEQNQSSLDSELDALLGEAQKEIALEKLYREAMKTVDADALLQGVEQDIDISFRDRVFKALKDSYKTVKTAVAERNN